MNLTLGDTELIISEAKARGLLRNQLAYVLATAYHETAHTMKPISEMGGIKYLSSKKYYPYYGRGYVQLTWDYNYIKAGKKLGVDFIKNPNLLLEPKYAIPILIIGMVEGWFTSKKLSDYIDLNKSNFESARQIINGLDDFQLIANYARQYDALLVDAHYGIEHALSEPQKPVQTIPEKPAVSVPLDHVPTVAPPVTSPEPGFFGIVIGLLTLLFGKRQG